MDRYLTEQIITYIGNKRKLLDDIESCICEIKKELSKNEVSCLDMFSGSGIVARLMKGHSSFLAANDIEEYSRIINECYLSNACDFDHDEYIKWHDFIEGELKKGYHRGVISENYAPVCDSDIKAGERVFYTSENAARIDSYRKAIDEVPCEMRKYFMAPLIYEASVHVNTSGVFKGFYKDSKSGLGKFGGDGENALGRIKGRIELPEPVFSSNNCGYKVYKEDANLLAGKLDHFDIAYIDPPYNQHPYGSNYFMLNIIADGIMPVNVSKVSGIPHKWNRSKYNMSGSAPEAFGEMLSSIDCDFAIVSYNSEGIMSYDEVVEILEKLGDVTAKRIQYNTFKGSRNLHKRSKYVDEYILF